MSRLFRSAAKTLLAKTLQALLSTYLEDVDVEGVALPSLLYSNATDAKGQPSGWGVRLSNVRLRQGAKLMDLQQQRQRRKKEKKKKKKKSTVVKISTSKRGRRHKKGASESHETNSSLGDGSKEEEPNDDKNNNNNNINEPLQQKDKNRDDHNSIPKTKEEHPDDAKVQADTTATIDPAPSSAASSSSYASSWFSWRRSSSVVEEEKAATDDKPTTIHDDVAARNSKDLKRTSFASSALSPLEEEEHEEELKGNQHHRKNNSTGGGLQSQVSFSNDNDGKMEMMDDANDNNNNNDDDEYSSDEDYSSDEEVDDSDDEDVWEQVPMRLQLGAAGRIGTLDVRLVRGKEIYVLVEDADLTVEVVRVASDATTAPSSENADGHHHDPAKDAAAAKEALAGTAEAGKQAKKKTKPTKEPQTPGERVTQENPLARLFSLLPNLLLRDIRVRLVVRGEDPNAKDKQENGIDDDEKEETPPSSSTETNGGTSRIPKLGPYDDAVELSIELLSATDDGNDFFAHFRRNDEDDDNVSNNDGDSSSSSSTSSSSSVNGLTSSTDLESDDKLSYAADDANPPNSSRNPTTTVMQNEYMTKRIRTGRGPEGGILLHIYSSRARQWTAHAAASTAWARRIYLAQTQNCVVRCSGLDIKARIFMGTQKEVQLVATTSTQGGTTWFTPAEDEEEDEAYSVDAMLFGGVDYIAPGPKPPLLPMREEPSSSSDNNGKNARSSQTNAGQVEDIIDSEAFVLWSLPGATTYYVDKNGIQSSAVGTSFHRFARGLQPTVGPRGAPSILPCEYSAECWDKAPIPAPGLANSSDNEHDTINKQLGQQMVHLLDEAAPMGGLVLNLSLRDALECNIDRTSLEVVGLLISLFSKKSPRGFSSHPTSKGASAPANNTIPAEGADHYLRDDGGSESATMWDADASQRSLGVRSLPASTSMDASTSSIRSAGRRRRGHHRSISAASLNPDGSERYNSFDHEESIADFDNPAKSSPARTARAADEEEPTLLETGDMTKSFPKYMQPEKIQYLGVCITKVIFRVHLMQSGNCEDHGLSFAYWNVDLNCITLDLQQFAVDRGPSFRDVRLDVGHVLLTDHRGLEKKTLLSVGLKQRVVDFDEVTLETLMTRDNDCQRPPWPSTAAVLLDLPPPLETLIYETRDRHALQLRLVAVRAPGRESDALHASAHIKVGAASVDMPLESAKQVGPVISEAKQSVLGSPLPSPQPPVEETKPCDHLIKYKLDIDGARLSLKPMAEARLPLSSFRGEHSTSAGVSLDTFLEHVNIHVGETVTNTIMADQRLSLLLLSDVPEKVRVRIWLFLDDLDPLAKALGVKSVNGLNSFLLCGAIDKQLLKIARKKRRKELVPGDAPSREGTSRRQEIMAELLKLDDDDLEDMWERWRGRRRHTARKEARSNSRF